MDSNNRIELRYLFKYELLCSETLLLQGKADHISDVNEQSDRNLKYFPNFDYITNTTIP